MVLEAMKTSVAQVCAKYAQNGLAEEEVQAWRQHMVHRGGEIFEPKVESQTRQKPSPGSPKPNPFVVFIATFSILVNCALAGLAAAVYFELLDLSSWFGDDTAKANTTAFTPPTTPPARPNLNTLLPSSSPERTKPPVEPPINLPSLTGSSPRTPVTSPIFGGPRSPRGPGMVSEVEVCGVRGRGSKVVFVLDLNEYMRTDPDGEKKFERLRLEVRDAVRSLGDKTAFNVILLDGISRLHLL